VTAPHRDYGWQGDEPSRTCAGCGERIVLKDNSIWFSRYSEIRTWHAPCRPQTKTVLVTRETS
jgi:hypothetical protein